MGQPENVGRYQNQLTTRDEEPRSKKGQLLRITVIEC